MITIDVSTAAHRGGSFDPSFRLIRSSVSKNVDVAVRIRRGSAEVLPPDHLLLQILNLIPLNAGASDQETYYRMRDRVYTIANSLNLTSATNYGKPQTKFLMDGCSELLLIHATQFDVGDWQNLKPIEFIYHEETNLNTLYGNSGRTDTVAYIAVNILMLAYQYQCWRRWHMQSGSMDSSQAFLFKYPMTNAIYSYIDISLFNRILYKQQGWQITPDKRYTLRSLLNVEQDIDKHVDYVLDVGFKQTRTIGQYLYGVELVYKLSALELIPTVSMLKSRTVEWFFNLSRLPLILYGNTMVSRLNPKYNAGTLSTWRREFGQSIDNHIWSKLPAAAVSHIKEDYLVKINMF